MTVLPGGLLNLLLLGALFVVGLLLLFRLSERLLSLLVTALALGLAALLAGLAVRSGQLDRAQGALVVAGVLLGTAPLRRGTERWRESSWGGPFRRTQSAALPQQPASGSTLPDLHFEHYEVQERIGVGGMGSVYRARRKVDGRMVALKVPQEKYLADAKFVKRFYREAEVLKRFNHPNIVRVYDYRMEEGEHYIAMEFLDGESLETLLEDRRLSFEESTQVLRALADALRHIHLHNVVHRDIKPANVMILKGAFVDGRLREGGVKLMDFGIAVGKVLTRLTMTGARVGTPIYMAPEQAKGQRVDTRSDVYSLGLLAYEMVTGQTAFKGSYEAVIHQQVFETPKPPKQVRLEVPGRLSDLILHMIEKDPDARPTLDDVIARLDAGVLQDDVFSDPVALALSVGEKRGVLRLLDLQGKLRLSLRDLSAAAGGLPSVPNALTSDPEGYLYLTLLEFRQGRAGALVRKLAPDGREVAAFGGYGLGEGELLQPVGIAWAQGHVYVLDGESYQVVVYDRQGRFVRRFGGRGPGLGRFNQPRAIVAAPDGQIYVLDSGNRAVQRFSPQGEYLSRYAFRLDRSSDALRDLEGLAVDPQGALYIVDGVARKVRKIEADGKPSLTFALETLVGEPTDAPWLLQVGAEGQMYAVRQGGQVLRTYSAAGDLLASRDMYAPVQALTLVTRPVPVEA
ncbi:serine/threonine protein kinase [Deinococcus geothermalis DSM 11300]|uniref:non-specific serine/threonine protein kinase n=1 Tax=Deinococcus geothermalis (strain DSM 11300 / CIP 105573 / AG-3a) TaxID=319795 RepID=Q1J0F4_DEIGD|nr:protein kinase [Deinococcus geothermalis]ABF45030.1 serine/threonine protein kinase [Deinococcus geothermalis DSM 11300]